jgi:acetate kinase
MLDGLDGVVFTGGIGEHAPVIHAMVGKRLGWLGAEIDRDANDRNAAVINAPRSRIQIRMIPTDEEVMIAGHTLTIIRSGLA